MRRDEQPFSSLSTSVSLLVMAGLLLLPFFSPTLDSGNATPESSAARMVPVPQYPEVAKPSPTAGWTTDELALSREQCAHILKSVNADLEFLNPEKQGGCGTPVLVLLKRMGTKSALVFDPPVEVNCQMAAALYHWNKSTLQPAARRTFHSPVASILGASGYVCRNVYSLPDRNLSQHAFANAIDLSAFALKDGRVITVRKGWGATKRDAKQENKKKSAAVRSNSRQDSINREPELRYAQLPGRGKITKTNLPTKDASITEIKAHRTQQENAAQRAQRIAASKFLKRLHSGACGLFDTVLGPEANDAHRSHFHFDLNPSRSGMYCN